MCTAGNIRRAEHFVAFMRRLVAHLRERLRSRQVVHELPPTFLAGLQERVAVDAKTLK
jgi:DNA excision repair protein ERCC-2